MRPTQKAFLRFMVSFDNLYNYKASSLYYVSRLWPKVDTSLVQNTTFPYIMFLLIWFQFCGSGWCGRTKTQLYGRHEHLKFRNVVTNYRVIHRTFHSYTLSTFLTIRIRNDNISQHIVIQKDGLNFVRLSFLNYTWYVNDLRNI
jgi:hypothetical protein